MTSFSLGHVLADVALLLVVKAASQLRWLLEQLLDVQPSGIAGLDRFLILLGEIGAGLVQAYQRIQLDTDGGLETSEAE